MLHGGRDYQIPMTDFFGWKDAFGDKDNWELNLYDDLNHAMVSGEGTPNHQEYFIPNFKVDETLLNDIVDFINK